MGLSETRRHAVFRVVALVLMTASLVLAGCEEKSDADTAADNATQAAGANNTGPQWVYPRNPNHRVAVVFIHGLFGDTLDTWSPDPAGKVDFFSLLKQNPEVGDKIDLFAFGFTSNMFRSGSLDAREAANSLEESLQANKVWEYDNVVFVAHSLGGLVTLRYLITNPEHLERVPLVVLYASPMDGSDMASIADNVARNPALAQMHNSDANEFLATLNEDWADIPAVKRPIVRCAYETAATKGVMVVKRRSATRFCVGNLVAIGGSDHLTIVKPNGPTHPSLQMLVNALNTVVLGTDREPRLDTPNFSVNDAGEWLYTLHAGSALNTAKLINLGERELTYDIGPSSSSRLLVLPRPTPRKIPGNNQEEIQLILNLVGEPLQPEYTFVLKADPLGPKTVRVKLDNPEALALAQQRSFALISEGINAFIDENKERLNALPDEAQRQEISEAARKAVVAQTPGLSEETQWVLTANALSATNFNDLSTIALRNVERLSPETAQTPAIKAMATQVSAQSGVRVFRDTPLRAPLNESLLIVPPSDGSPPGPGMEVIDVRTTVPPEALAARMQEVSSQRLNGLVLEGDVQRKNGELDRAAATYRDASTITATPAVRQRIKNTQATRAATPQQ
ncbi:MAG TPA: alpha/beta hydrolase [Pseudoxanthomonas sp.]